MLHLRFVVLPYFSYQSIWMNYCCRAIFQRLIVFLIIAPSYISTTPFHLFWLILIILLTLISTMIKSWEQKLLRFLLGHFLIVYSRMGVNALTGEALNHPPSGPMPRNCLVSANCSSDLASTSLRTWYLDQFPSPHKICLSLALVNKLRYIWGPLFSCYEYG